MGARTSGQFELDGVLRCGSSRPGTDERCKQKAGHGTDHPGFGNCKRHGGSTPMGKKGAALKEARASIPMFGNPLPDNLNPIEILLGEVRRSAGVVYWMADQIAQWDADAPIRRGREMTLNNGQQLIETTGEGYKKAAWLQVYGEERDRLVRHTKAAIDSGIAERQVRISEEMGQRIAMVLSAVMRDLALTAEQRAAYPEIVRKHLTIAGELVQT